MTRLSFRYAAKAVAVLRYNQKVGGSAREGISKSHTQVILVDNLRRNLAFNDSIEDCDLFGDSSLCFLLFGH